MKKYILRFSVVLGVWLLSLPVQSWLSSLQQEYSRPSRFFLPRQLSAKFRAEAGLKPGERILSVILAGRFSNWDPANLRFRMQESVAGWERSLLLQPGDHPYKFVLVTVPPGGGPLRQLWIPDPGEGRREPDSFGGYNSLHRVNSTVELQTFLRFLVLTLAFGSIMLTLLEVVIRRVMFLRISLKYKLVIVFLLFLLLSNIFYVMYMGSQQRKTVLHAQIDMISMLHVNLLADGVDFSRLTAPDTRERIRRRLEGFFANAWLRQDYNSMGNSRVQLVRVMVLDGKGALLVSAAEKSSRLVAQSRFRTVAEQDGFFAAVGARMIKQGVSMAGDGLVSVNYNDFPDPALRARWGELLLRRENARIYHFPHNLFLYPIRTDGLPVGYYLFEINAQSYSGLLGGMLRLNLLYLLVILVLYFFLMKYAGEIILKPINMVVEGINHIRSGDYTYQIWIATNDELDNLGKVYNYTRKKLHYTRKELEHYTQHLESVVEDRARELNRAWKILKEDLFLAKRIQKNLLSSDISRTRGVDISVAYQPLGDVGGDFYSINEVGPDRIRIFLADATGHGVQAALVTMLIKSEYEKMKDVEDPVAILKRMNHQFINTYRSLTVFFTGVIVDIDLKQRELRYSAAGHPAQYLLSGNSLVRLFERGKMIGVVSEPEFPVQRVPFRDDDKLVLFTDGLFEQFNPEGDEMGENHLHSFLNKLAEGGIARQDVGQISSLLLKSGDDFREGSEMNDDVTLICVGFRRHIPLLKPGKSRIRGEE